MSFISNAFSSNARQFGSRPLSDDELRTLVPSAFAEQAHESRSDRFVYIPTSEILTSLRNEGFVPTFAVQGKSRTPGKENYTRHMIRVRHVDAKPALRKVGEVYAEGILWNSHDGTSAYGLESGLLRLWCTNGCVAHDKTLSSVRVPHKGDIIGKVIDGTYEVTRQSYRALEAAETWASINLSRDEQLLLADGARTIRYGDENGEVTTPIKAEQMLTVRRRGDEGSDLWTVFNRVQEASVRGGMSASYIDSNNRMRQTTARAINGIDQNLKVNKALWTLAARMAELKA